MVPPLPSLPHPASFFLFLSPLALPRPSFSASKPHLSASFHVELTVSSQQERNRLDISHKFFLVARKEALHSAPLHPLPPGEKHYVLDLGTGTGIWAIDMAM